MGSVFFNNHKPANVFGVYESGSLVSLEDAQGNQMLSTSTVNDYADLPSPGGTNTRRIIVVLNLGLNGIPFISNGTEWTPLGGIAVLDNITSKQISVQDSLVTGWTAANNGGTVQITSDSAIAHGINLTGGHLVVKGAGHTGWVDLDKHQVTAFTATTIDLATTWDAGMGAVNFYAEGEDIEVERITVPYMSNFGRLELNILASSNLSTANTKRVKVDFGTQEYRNLNLNNDLHLSFGMTIQNLGSQTSQQDMRESNDTGLHGTLAADPVSSTIDTSVPQDLIFKVNINESTETVGFAHISARYIS